MTLPMLNIILYAAAGLSFVSGLLLLFARNRGMRETMLWICTVFSMALAGFNYIAYDAAEPRGKWIVLFFALLSILALVCDAFKKTTTAKTFAVLGLALQVAALWGLPSLLLRMLGSF